MPRLNRKSELWSHLSEVGVFRDGGTGSSTSTGTQPSPNVASPVLNVVSGTGFTANDYFRVRAPDNKVEINQVASIATNAITCVMPLYQQVAVGDPVVEVVQTSLGHILDGGVTLQISGEENEVMVANRRLALGYLTGNLEISLSFAVTGFNLENVVTALGMLESSITGTGASASNPYRVVSEGSRAKEQNDLCWYFNGVRKDGGSFQVHAWGCELDYSALRSQLQRGQVAALPLKLNVTSGLRLINF